MAKAGCGTAAGVLIVLITILIFGGNEAVGIYFAECPEEEFFDCLMEIMEEDAQPEEGSVVATGSYEYKGYSVTVTANIPLKGGNVTGSISGSCEGNLKGQYNGQNNGVVTGKLLGTCDPFFIKIPASADVTGTVNKTSRTVPITFEGRGGGLTHNGSMTLTWPEPKKE